jgi:WD40 repeat protein
VIQKFEVLPRGATVIDLQFSSNSRLLVFAGDDTSVGILNTMHHRVDAIFMDHDKNYSCTSVSLNLSDNLIASGSSDGTLIIRSIKENEVIV